MRTTGKIGLVLPEIYDSLDYELLRGVHGQAQKFGLDVICFTGIFNSQIELQQDDYIHAPENIYSLVCKAELDGIIFAAEQFHNLRREVQTAPQKEWSITEIARQIGISRSHLQRLYKELFQISIKDDMIAARNESHAAILFIQIYVIIIYPEKKVNSTCNISGNHV